MEVRTAFPFDLPKENRRGHARVNSEAESTYLFGVCLRPLGYDLGIFGNFRNFLCRVKIKLKNLPSFPELTSAGFWQTSILYSAPALVTGRFLRDAAPTVAHADVFSTHKPSTRFAGSIRRLRISNVRLWSLADISATPPNVRFREKRTLLPLMTLSGHHPPSTSGRSYSCRR
jgi:hypothetical protein